MAEIPSPELVTIAYLKLLPGLPVDKIATSLPANAAVWGATGFVQVSSVAGSPQIETPLWSPVVQLDFWAANPNSGKPPWGHAAALAARCVWEMQRRPSVRVLDVGLDGFADARLLSAFPLSEPRRIPDDAAGYARVQFDAQINWTVVGSP